MADLVLGLAKSAVEGTLTTAKSAIEEEAKLKKGVQRDLMLISDEFEMMHSVLNVAKDHVVTDDVTRTLVRQVRNMALDVEDCIESGVHLEDKSRWWRRMLPSSSCVPSAGADDLDATVADMELLKARVEAMGHRNLRYSRIGDPAGPKPGKQTQQQPVASAKATNVLAMAMDTASKDGRRVELAELLISKKDVGVVVRRQHQVISVLGTAGAMSVIKRTYDDQEIGKTFRCRAWVKLMHPFSPHEFIRSLLDQFYRNGCPLMDLRVLAKDDGDLVEEVRKQMSNLKYNYLVILEQVSNMVDWESVRACLPDESKDSCIVVVVNTHEVEIAALCVGYPHRVLELEKMSADHSIYAIIAGEKDAAGKDDKTLMDMKLKTAREWLQQNQLLGRQNELFWLSKFVFPNRVVSVWGMSGVGKSFLVKHIYYREMISYHKKGGWVDVSHPFDLRELSWSLLLDLKPGYLQDRMMPTTKDPVQACREYLQEHEDHLIVIDGLQSVEEWNSIKAALLRGTSDRRHSVVVITNEESIAKYCATHMDYMCNITGLEADHANELFKRKRENTKIDEVIVQKCGGLPKVICAVASMSRNYLLPWFFTRETNLVSTLEANTYFMTENLEYLFAWLVSYFRSCPDNLKPCIFYLSIFPLNHTIRRRRLVRRWIAEGYARDNKEGTAEDNGEMCYSDLVFLSMIQVPPFFMGMPPLCQVNGFLREYIISRSMEENLVFSLEGQCSMRLLRVLDLEDVSSGLTNGDVELVVKLLPRLKFLSMRRCRGITRLPDSLGDLKQLQTLDIRETSVIKLPRSISKLEKLQYIRAGTAVTLDGAGMVTRDPQPPADIDNRMALSSLQPPNNGNNVMFERLPSLSSPPPSSSNRKCPSLSAKRLMKRVHATLLCPHDGGSHNLNGIKVPRGIGKLSSLHTLGVIDISGAKGVLEELSMNLTHLQKLGVSSINRNNIQHLFSAISGLANLKSLSLQGQLDEGINEDGISCLECISKKTIDNLLSLKLYGLGRTLPIWTMELRNLKKLSLQMTVLPQEVIDIIVYNLMELHSLRIHVSEFEDDVVVFTGLALSLLEISCNSRRQARIMFHQKQYLSVLRLRCWGVSSLLVSGLKYVKSLKEVWLSRPCDDAQKQNFESEVAMYPERRGKPALRFEEPAGSSTSTPWLRTSS
ncbi:unnamed protein product [Urochloa decumbens]|uniref:Disease resistance protein RPM1 n=1 Tax=Urochloa decumbens TaxID=240449 RepID=A0ABC9AQ62_9POAL